MRLVALLVTLLLPVTAACSREANESDIKDASRRASQVQLEGDARFLTVADQFTSRAQRHHGRMKPLELRALQAAAAATGADVREIAKSVEDETPAQRDRIIASALVAGTGAQVPTKVDDDLLESLIRWRLIDDLLAAGYLSTEQVPLSLTEGTGADRRVHRSLRVKGSDALLAGLGGAERDRVQEQINRLLGTGQGSHGAWLSGFESPVRKAYLGR